MRSRVRMGIEGRRKRRKVGKESREIKEKEDEGKTGWSEAG